MATVQGLTKQKMQEIVDATIVSAKVEGGHLILTRHDGTDIDAGAVGGGGGGTDGESAYQLAVDQGYTGTLTQWLASLKGDPGDPGGGAVPNEYHFSKSSTGPILLPQDYRNGLDLRDFVDESTGRYLRPDSLSTGADNLATDHMPIFQDAFNALIAAGRGKLKIPCLGPSYGGRLSDGQNDVSGSYRLMLPAGSTDPLLPIFDFDGDTLDSIIDIDFDNAWVYTGATDWKWARDPQAWDAQTYPGNGAAAVIRAVNTASTKFLRIKGLHLRGPDTAVQTGLYARNAKIWDPTLIMQGVILQGRCAMKDSMVEGFHIGVNVSGDHMRFVRVNATGNTINWFLDGVENQKDDIFDACYGSRARWASRGFHQYFTRDTNDSWDHCHFGQAPFDRIRLRYSLPRNDGVTGTVAAGQATLTSAGTNLSGPKPANGSNWEQKLEVNDWITIHGQTTGSGGAAMYGKRYKIASVAGPANQITLADTAPASLVGGQSNLIFSMEKDNSTIGTTTLREWIVGSTGSDTTAENVGNCHFWDDAEVPNSLIIGQKMDAPFYSGIDDGIMMPLSLADPTTPAYSGVAGTLSAGSSSQFVSAGAGFSAAIAKDSWLEILGMAIASIDGTGVITTVNAHHLCSGDGVHIEIPGIASKNYIVSNNTSLTSTTFGLTNTINGTNNVNPGAFAAGAYVARLTRQPLQISSLVAGANTTINFTKRHALVTSDRLTLGGISGTMGDVLNGQDLAITVVNSTQITVGTSTVGTTGSGGYAYRSSSRGYFELARYFRITDAPDATHLTLEMDPQVSEPGLAWRVVYRPRMHARVGQYRECTMPIALGTDSWSGFEGNIQCQDPPFNCEFYFQEPVQAASKTYYDNDRVAGNDPPGTNGGLPMVIQVVNYNNVKMNQLGNSSRSGNRQFILARPLPGTVIHRGEFVSVTPDAANGLQAIRPFDPTDPVGLGAVIFPAGYANTMAWVGVRGDIYHIRFPWTVSATPTPALVADAVAKGMIREQGDALQLSGLIGYRTDAPDSGFCSAYLFGNPQQVATIRETLGPFGRTALTGTIAAADALLIGGSATVGQEQKHVVCMRRGFVTGLMLNMFPKGTAGNITAVLFKNGVTTGQQITSVSPWPQGAAVSIPIGLVPFVAGDVLSVQISSGTWAPTSSAMAWIEVGY